ncbi:Alpha/Beta hydrolase protein [Coprinopsis sp. MPI-PUGE-AT-0042]|nr:Alpha/Beta hydrolase protein [Coprinopsis sp. MPI-PUGE-AT-0042]
MNATLDAVETYVTSTDGVQIYATAVGNSSLPAIVLVHGFACSALIWANLLQNQDLLKQFYLVAYELRGHGRSGKPDTAAGYLSSLFADDFAAVSRAFNLESPLFLGWSYGGLITIDLFAHLPANSISGIVYVASGPIPITSLAVINTPLVTETLLPGFLSLDNATVALESRQLFVDSVVNEPEKVPVEVKWAWLGNTALTGPKEAQLLLSREQNSTAILEAGSKGFPTLLITGGKDQFANGEPLKAELEKSFSNLTTHHIPEGSHAMFYDSEEEFVTELVKFASSVL